MSEEQVQPSEEQVQPSEQPVERTDEQWVDYFGVAMRGAPNPNIEGLHDLMIWCIKRSDSRSIRVAVEIGTYAGQSASVICKYAGSTICVDPYVAGYDPEDGDPTNSEMFGREHLVMEAATKNIGECDCEIVQTTSEDAASKMFHGIQADFVYIDGDHRYESVKRDLELWTPVVKMGGFVAGHDYNDRENLAGVKRAVHDFFGREPDAVFQDTSWVYRV